MRAARQASTGGCCSFFEVVSAVPVSRLPHPARNPSPLNSRVTGRVVPALGADGRWESNPGATWLPRQGRLPARPRHSRSVGARTEVPPTRDLRMASVLKSGISRPRPLLRSLQRRDPRDGNAGSTRSPRAEQMFRRSSRFHRDPASPCRPMAQTCKYEKKASGFADDHGAPP
jgi:hypothetical protein